MVGGGGGLIRGGLLYLLVDLISGLVEGVLFGGGRRRGLIRGGLLYLLVDLISGLVEGVIFGGGRRGTTVFVGGSDIWPGRGSDLWWWEEGDYCICW